MRWWTFPRVLAAVVAVYLAGMAGVIGFLAAQSADFTAGARVTSGTVVALVPRAAAGSAREPSPEVREMPLAPVVSYVVGETSYTTTASYGRYRQRLRVGDTVQVRYLPAAPAQARLGTEGRAHLPLVSAAFGAAALVVVLLLLGTARRSRPGSPRRSERPGGTAGGGRG